MSEAIAEMILPGTYIEVRSEGLIGVGGISTGNIGIVGTANKGPVNQVEILGSYSEALDLFGSYDRFVTTGTPTPTPLTLTRALEQVFKGGGSTVYAVRVANGAPGTMQWSIRGAGDPAPELLRLSASSPGSWANTLNVTFAVATGTLTAELGRIKETFIGADLGTLVDDIRAGSRLLSAPNVADADRDKPVRSVAVVDANAGSDGAAATTVEAHAGLDLLATQPVNIVTVAGMDATTVGATLLAHVEATENDGRERLAVVGASSDDPAHITSTDADALSNPRVILVAPGILADDAARTTETVKQVKLPAAYAAALVSGRLATLAVHISLTNKDVATDGLTSEYTRAVQKQLLNNRVLVLQKNLGIRVLKGITTDTGAFRQISVRRIVDYAKAGVRIGCNPYIGRLNNARVRAALKATLDGFLSGMVLDEMLIGYQLDVTATRAQEIQGIALVTMTLQPTFSIDFVKVIMTLQ
jgi:hypothetical protein